MKLLLILLPGLVFSQTLTMNIPGTVRAGSTVTGTISLSGTGSIAAMQWTFSGPAGFAMSSVASTASGKAASCNTTTCLLWGMNQSTIAPGAVATFQLTVPKSASGNVNLTLNNTIVSSPTGVGVSLTATPFTVSISPAISDLNGDGTTDSVDVQLMITRLLAGGTCTGDQNGDGVCNVVDVQLVVNAALAP